MDKMLIIIPAYNEEANLKRVVNRIKEEVPWADYVVINDGSLDDTRAICETNRFQYLDLPVNIGLSGAIRAGMKYAVYEKYDYVVQIDGDGQHRPEYISELLKCMKETGAGIVIGSRFKNKKKPASLRMLGSRLISGAIWLTTKGDYIGDVTSGMRLYDRNAIIRYANGINYRPEPDTVAYLINHGIKVREVQVEMDERIAGTSYLSIGNSVNYMIHVLFNILFFQWVRKD